MASVDSNSSPGTRLENQMVVNKKGRGKLLELEVIGVGILWVICSILGPELTRIRNGVYTTIRPIILSEHHLLGCLIVKEVSLPSEGKVCLEEHRN